MHRFFVLLVLGGPLLFAGCASMGQASGGGKSGKGPVVGSPFPEIVVKPLRGGHDIRLGSMHGKVVLVDIWASWCAPCKEEMPLLDEIAARLKPAGVEIIAVSIDEDRGAAEDFLRTR